MTLARLAKQAEKFASDNSPAILTGIAIIGSLSAAYLTGKASFKAAAILEDERERRFRMNETESEHAKIEPRDIVKLVWKQYLPAAGTLAITVGCIVGSNQIGSKRTAAMAAAYTISDKAFTEYKEKVVEKIGENREREVRDEIQQDRIDQKPINGNVIVMGNADVLCYDKYSGRYFTSNMEAIKKAQNDTNYELIHQGYASLSDFYSRLGLPATNFSEEVGWTSDHQLEVVFSTTMSDDDRPCLCLDYHVAPVRHFNKFG